MNLKVLLLEDDATVSLELERALAGRACEVVTLASAEEGLGQATADRFDLIVLSTELPGANGFELCDRLKSDPSTAQIPIFVVSSTSSRDDFAVQQRRGTKADGFFTKPVVIAELLASLPAELGADDLVEDVTLARQSPSMRPPLPRVSTPPGPGAGAKGSVDLREALKTQERVVVSLRADLSARSQVIGRLEAKNKELAQRLADAEERERAHIEELAFLERAHGEASAAAAARLVDAEQALTIERAARGTEAAAHARELAEAREETASVARQRDDVLRERDEARSALEIGGMDLAQAQIDFAEETRARAADARKHADALDELGRSHRAELEEVELAHAVARGNAASMVSAKSNRLEELEKELAAEREAGADSVAKHARTLTDAAKQREDHEQELAAARARHEEQRRELEARVAALETRAAEATGARAESEAVVAQQRAELERMRRLEAELAEAKKNLAETSRALDKAERDAIQQQLARDAAFHDMNVQAAAERDAAVEAVKSAAALEREELIRAHEEAFTSVRDKAVAQALSVLKKQKK